MVDPLLLEILVCPETHRPLRPADGALLERLNERVRAGSLRTRGGAAVDRPLEEALVRDDGQIAYPVRAGIPVMLIEEAIPLD